MSYNKIRISQMTLSDFNDIENILLTDFDDFWDVSTLKNELINNSSFYIFIFILYNISFF